MQPPQPVTDVERLAIRAGAFGFQSKAVGAMAIHQARQENLTIISDLVCQFSFDDFNPTTAGTVRTALSRILRKEATRHMAEAIQAISVQRVKQGDGGSVGFLSSLCDVAQAEAAAIGLSDEQRTWVAIASYCACFAYGPIGADLPNPPDDDRISLGFDRVPARRVSEHGR